MIRKHQIYKLLRMVAGRFANNKKYYLKERMIYIYFATQITPQATKLSAIGKNDVQLSRVLYRRRRELTRLTRAKCADALI